MEVSSIPFQQHGSNSFSIQLHTLGQQPDLNIYTQISLLYHLEDSPNSDQIILILQHGLERLGHSFPWTAGQVLLTEGSAGDAPKFCIKPFRKSPILIIKDLRKDESTPTFSDLRKANYPFRMFQERVVAPRMTFPKPDEDEAIPTFAVQANFIKGGLILTFAGQHQAMDMIGLGEGIKFFDKACKGEAFNEDEIQVGNMERKGIIPLIEDDSYKKDEHLAKQIIKPIAEKPDGEQQDATAAPEAIWTYFSFSNASLVELKKLAMDGLSKQDETKTSFVSTDDVLSSLIFRCITRARLPRLSYPGATATLARAVDIRRYVSLPLGYPGSLQNMFYLSLSVPDITEPSTSAALGLLGSKLRFGVDPHTSTIGRNTRSLITLMEKTGNMTAASVVAPLNLDTDIMLSSWAAVPCYDMEFGLGLGRPEAVRRPEFEKVASLIYLMPKRSDGEISVAVCLSIEDMERLKKGEEMMKYATCIE